MDAADSHPPTSAAVSTQASRAETSAGDAPARAASGEAEMPGWFVEKRVKRATAGQAPESPNRTHHKRGPIETPEEDDQALPPWPQRLKGWLLSPEARGYLMSFVFHSLLLLALSLTFFSGMPGTDRISTMWSQPDSELADFQEIDTRLEETRVNQEAAELPQLQPVEAAKTEVADVETAIRERALSAIEKRMQSGISGGTGFDVPEKGNAVTKGSFTAWTIPDHPVSGENYHYKDSQNDQEYYLIVIQIQLPERMRRYPTKDLTGSFVKGTDEWYQEIPNRFSDPPVGYQDPKYLPVNKKDQAQLVVTVPLGASGVDERIELKSRMLNEEQLLEFEF